MYWNSSILFNRFGRFSLNSNMGCIETVIIVRTKRSKWMLNSNMGCIETWYQRYLRYHIGKLNSNMGCIETLELLQAFPHKKKYQVISFPLLPHFILRPIHFLHKTPWKFPIKYVKLIPLRTPITWTPIQNIIQLNPNQ